MSISKIYCHKCGKDSPVLGTVGRRDECPFCRADLHVCLNCLHYDQQSYNECHEPQADRVVEKNRSNFCDYFVPNEEPQDRVKNSQSLLANAESLFKKKT